jgi:hypothetical protein
MRVTASIIAALLLAAHSRGLGGELVLRVALADAIVRHGESVAVEASITNASSAAVTLVVPGDGSGVGWRTPVTGWSFLPEASDKQHGEPVPDDTHRFCGNINPLKRSEVFTLQPSESRVFRDWIQPRADLPPGRYRAVLYYRNEPTRKITGIPLGGHEAGVEDLIRRSTPCLVISNEVVLTVTPEVPSLLKRPNGG